MASPATAVPPPRSARLPLSAWEQALAEYEYMNFPAREIAEWLLPQMEGAKRVVLLDDTQGAATDALLNCDNFRRVPLAGVWSPAPLDVPSLSGVPRLGSVDEIVNSRPDCLVPFFRTLKAPPLDLPRLEALTGAKVIPSVLFHNPFAGSQMIRYAPGGRGLSSPDYPLNFRQSLARHMQRYFSCLQIARGGTVLDCACGVGYGTHLLARVARRAVGVDLNPHLIGYAGKYNAGPNIRYICKDLTLLAEEIQVDLLTSIETFEHVPSDKLDAFVDALHRLIRPGGTLVCSTPKALRTFHAPPNRQHVAEYSTEDFSAVLGRRFRVDTVYFQTHEPEIRTSLPAGYPLPDSTENTHVVQIAACTRI